MSSSPNSKRRLWLLGVGLAGLCAFNSGCGETPTIGAPIDETPEKAAARVLDVAEGFASEGNTSRAFAAYHQVIQKYPKTPSAKTAAQRIRGVLKESSKKKGSHSGHQHVKKSH